MRHRHFGSSVNKNGRLKFIPSVRNFRLAGHIFSLLRTLSMIELYFAHMIILLVSSELNSKACFKRRASHVPNALEIIDNEAFQLIIYCF
jgi:hypothetical protein